MSKEKELKEFIKRIIAVLDTLDTIILEQIIISFWDQLKYKLESETLRK